MLKIIINKYVTKLGLNCCKKSFRKPKNGRKNGQKKNHQRKPKNQQEKATLSGCTPINLKRKT
jgi:hypothetical protein